MLLCSMIISVKILQEMEQMEAPPELLMTLLPYQKEFLAWAVKQERGDIKGGILADEMGMGKTIQVHTAKLVNKCVIQYICHKRLHPAKFSAADDLRPSQ